MSRRGTRGRWRVLRGVAGGLTLLGLALGLVPGIGQVATACGPYFPYWIVTDPGAPLDAKVLTFAAALAGRVEPVSETDWEAGIEMAGGTGTAGETADSLHHTLAVERRQVAEALGASGLTDDDARAVLAQVDGLRRSASSPPAGPPSVSSALPTELRLYLEGASAFHRDQVEVAAESFRSVLDLPPGERPLRSTWAAFMLGRLAATGDDPDAALEHFRRVRALAAEGFSDPLGLAAASLGRMGGVELARGRYERAFGHYIEEYRVDPRGPGATNLRWAAGAALTAPPERLAELAADDLSRRVVTAYLLAHDPRDASPEPWLTALEAAAEALPEDGGSFAWLSYQAGDFAAARRWVDRATADGDLAAAGPLARWVHAKLLLRSGRLEEGRELLETVGDPRATAEAGVVALATEDFTGALRLLVDADYGPDALYVAEKVLTLPELVAFEVRAESTSLPKLLAEVTAHRLARDGRLEDAARVYPGGEPVQAAWLRRWLAEAEDPTRPAAERARAYFFAADLLRDYGLALRGTLLGPDWALFDGQYDLAYLAPLRAHPTGPTGDPAPETWTASAAELARARAARPIPDARWHYRYVAAEAVWKGAHLLPVGEPDAVRRLCEAGSWLADHDPAAADRYYKALVRRGGDLPLARAADRRRWFPPSCDEAAG